MSLKACRFLYWVLIYIAIGLCIVSFLSGNRLFGVAGLGFMILDMIAVAALYRCPACKGALNIRVDIPRTCPHCKHVLQPDLPEEKE